MNKDQLDNATAPRSALVDMAVKIAQMYLTSLPHGSGKKVRGYHVTCYEVFALMELEFVPKMVFESVTRTEFFEACEAKGFLTLAKTFETEFASQLGELCYTTTRWFAEQNDEMRNRSCSGTSQKSQATKPQ